MDKVKFLKDVEIPNLQITGDLTVQGEAVVSNLETVVTPQNTIKLRDGATTALMSNEYTGIIAEKYNGADNGMLVFNNAGTAYVGDEGDLQPLATRDESANITDNSILIWDAAKQRIVDGSAKIKYAGSDSVGGPATIAEKAIRDNLDRVINETYISKDDIDDIELITVADIDTICGVTI